MPARSACCARNTRRLPTRGISTWFWPPRVVSPDCALRYLMLGPDQSGPSINLSFDAFSSREPVSTSLESAMNSGLSKESAHADANLQDRPDRRRRRGIERLAGAAV